LSYLSIDSTISQGATLLRPRRNCPDSVGG